MIVDTRLAYGKPHAVAALGTRFGDYRATTAPTRCQHLWLNLESWQVFSLFSLGALNADEIVRLLRQECPDISLITCHDETLCVSWFPGMDGALIGFAGCVPELICPAWDVFKNPDKHTLKEAQDWSNRIYPISQAIYGGGQPSGEAHARLKEALKQRGIFTSALMRKPVLPLNQEEKDWVALGLERSQLPAVDMEQYK